MAVRGNSYDEWHMKKMDAFSMYILAPKNHEIDVIRRFELRLLRIEEFKKEICNQKIKLIKFKIHKILPWQ